jgi:hypothetical protein
VRAAPVSIAQYRTAVELTFCTSCLHAPIIWSLYLAFELARGTFVHAKNVYLRGMVNLPWCKWFTIVGLAHLSPNLQWSEAESIYRSLEDKELRVHLDISHVLEEFKASMKREPH